jgi:hypothetical protein
VKVRPPAVAVTPATTGAGARKRHRGRPVAASNAATQPRASRRGSMRPNGSTSRALPVHGTPVFPSSRPGGVVHTVVHQSTVPTTSVPDAASYAGPFHSAPPCTPGQKRTPAGVGATVSLSSVVVVDAHSLAPPSRAKACR